MKIYTISLFLLFITVQCYASNTSKQTLDEKKFGINIPNKKEAISLFVAGIIPEIKENAKKPYTFPKKNQSETEEKVSISPTETFSLTIFGQIKERTANLSVSERIEILSKEHHPAFFDLVNECKDKIFYRGKGDSFIYFASRETLESFNLLKKDGKPKEEVKEFVKKHVEGKGFSMKYVAPKNSIRK